MRQRLAFVETGAQWRSLRELADSQLVLVPVLPETDRLAQEEGLDCATVEDFCSHATLMRRGDRNNHVVDRICDRLDVHLTRLLNGVEIPGSEMVSAHAFFHPLKGLLDALVRRAMPLIVAMRTLRPTEVVCFEVEDYEVGGLGLLDKPAWSLTTHLVPVVAASLGVPLRVLPAPVEVELEESATAVEQVEREPVPASAPLPGERLNHDGQALLIHSLFQDLGRRMFDTWFSSGLGTQLPFGAVFPERVVAGNRQLIQPYGDALWRAVAGDPELRALFEIDGVDLWAAVSSTLLRICKDGIPDLLAYAPVVDQGLAGVSNAVIATGGMMERNAVLGAAAAKHGVPMVTMHFGGYVGYSHMPMHERYDLGDADWFVTGGEGSELTMAEPRPEAYWPAGRKRARPVGLGGTWVEDIAERYRGHAPTGRRRILYALSALLGDNVFLGYIFHPEIWYQRFQRRLVEVLATYAAEGCCEVLLKFPMRSRYPQVTNPLFEELQRDLPPGVELLSADTPLVDLFGEADAFIVDSPSTPLVQLAATDKPFLVYADRDYFLFDERAKQMLSRRAAFSETETGFFDSLREFMQRPDWSPGPVDDSFLSSYAAGGTDGQAARRIAEFCYRVATGREAATPVVS